MSYTRQAARMLVAGLEPRKRVTHARGQRHGQRRARSTPAACVSRLEHGALPIEAARGRRENRHAHAHALPHTQHQGGWSVKAHIIGGCVASTTQHGIQPGRARVRSRPGAKRRVGRKVRERGDEEIALRAHAMPSIRRKDRTQCGPHRRVRVTTRRPSKTAGCRPFRNGNAGWSEQGGNLT